MTPESEQAVLPAPPEPGYDLTPGETMVLQSLNQQTIHAKLTVYAMNSALEKALKEVDRLEAQFAGALTILANAHGMSAAQITPDFKRIAPPKE